jgi:hypothetical protein
MTTERDIQFSLRLDRLAASIETAEAALLELRAEYDELLAMQRAHLDDDTEPHTDREWLGHGLIERAMDLLRSAPDVSADAPETPRR